MSQSRLKVLYLVCYTYVVLPVAYRAHMHTPCVQAEGDGVYHC